MRHLASGGSLLVCVATAFGCANWGRSECSTDADCVAIAGEGATCHAAASVCVAAEDAGAQSVRDAGESPSDAGFGYDGGQPPGDGGDSVRVKRMIHHHLADGGIVDVDTATSSQNLKIWRVDGGHFQPVGIVYENGTISAYVPAGETYYAQIDDVFVVTDARLLDLSENRLGSPDNNILTAVARNAPFSVSLAGAPSGTKIGLRFLSEAAGISTDLTAVDPLPANTTEIMNEPFLGRLPHGKVLRDGDSGLIARWAREPVPDAGSSAVVLTHATAVDFLSVASDGVVHVSGELSALPVKTRWAEIDLAAFAQLSADVHPDAVPDYAGLDIYPSTARAEHGRVGEMDALFHLPLFSASSGFSGTIRYSSPAPWAEFGEANFRTRRQVTLASGEIADVNAHFRRRRLAGELFQYPIAPAMHPPEELKVDGQSGWPAQEFTVGSLSPVVSWRPPAVGVPNGYSVRIFRLNDAGMIGSRKVAEILTAAVSVRVPPDLIERGKPHYVTVEAFKRSAPFDVADSPLLDWTEEDAAEAMSSTFVVP